jgi:protein-disulfide isomerase
MGILGALVGVAVVVAAIAVIAATGGDDEAQTAEDVSLVREMFEGIPQQGVVLGESDAPATLEIYEDLQCPFCKQFADDVLPLIVQDYVRPGRLRLVQRTLTFLGDDSVRAGRMAIAAGLQGLGWNFTELFYRRQGPEQSAYADDDFLRDLLRDVGADVDRAFADRDSAPVIRRLSQDQQEAQRHGITSTPSFMLGPTGGELTRLEVQALDIEQFRQPLEQAIERAGGDGAAADGEEQPAD